MHLYIKYNYIMILVK